MRKRLKAAGILLAGLLLATQAVAGLAGATPPGTTGTTTITFQIIPRIILVLSTATIDFGDLEPGTSEFGDRLTTTVRSNTLWRLTAAAPNFSAGIPPALTIPITRLSTRQGDAAYVAMADLAAVTLLSGQPRGGNWVHSWDYRLTIEWTDVPATYSTTITYTATGS